MAWSGTRTRPRAKRRSARRSPRSRAGSTASASQPTRRKWTPGSSSTATSTPTARRPGPARTRSRGHRASVRGAARCWRCCAARGSSSTDGHGTTGKGTAMWKWNEAMTRRNVLQLGFSTAALLTLPPMRWLANADPTNPHFLVMLFADGGWDPTQTLDVHDPLDATDGIDVDVDPAISGLPVSQIATV